MSNLIGMALVVTLKQGKLPFDKGNRSCIAFDNIAIYSYIPNNPLIYLPINRIAYWRNPEVGNPDS